MSALDIIKKGEYTTEIRNLEFTSTDLMEVAEEYAQIETLIDIYNEGSMEIDRKILGEAIKTKLEPLVCFMALFKNSFDILKANYRFARECISDTSLALRILLRLANRNGDKYSIKAFRTADFTYLSEKGGLTDLDGNIHILGETKVLDEIDNNKNYFGNTLNSIITRLIQDGHSLIITRNQKFITHVVPNVNSRYDKHVKFNTCLEDLIDCYLFNGDELTSAIKDFQNFIDDRGADIKGLDEDELFKYIDGMSKPKKMEMKPIQE